LTYARTTRGDELAADYDKGLLTVRVKNVTKPVEEPRKIEIKGGSVVKAVTKEDSVAQAA
jgi:hypothetical protein